MLHNICVDNKLPLTGDNESSVVADEYKQPEPIPFDGVSESAYARIDRILLTFILEVIRKKFIVTVAIYIIYW